MGYVIHKAVKEPECQTVQGYESMLGAQVGVFLFYFTACPNCTNVDSIQYSIQAHSHAATSTQ